MTDDHRRPEGTSDATVEAVGKVTEALEWVERARGDLYDFHQKMGHADALFGEAATMLADADHDATANELRDRIVGRNAIDGRWSFQIVEEFDDGYWHAVREQERSIRNELTDGRRHVLESEMKDDRRTHGRLHHERRPAGAHDRSVTAVEGTDAKDTAT